jgi:hypothetical protein
MKTKTKTRTGIKAKIKFYSWPVSIGADLKNFEPENIEIHELPKRKKSSFKNRSAQIKAKYNHRFKLNHTSDDLLNSYPDIGTLEFIKVTNPNLFKTKTA